MLPVLIYAPGWADAVEAGSLLGIWGVVFVFLGIQRLGQSKYWAMFSRPSPMHIENFFSRRCMMFLVQIIFNMLGWRKKLQARVDVEIDQWNAERGLIKGKLPSEGDA